MTHCTMPLLLALALAAPFTEALADNDRTPQVPRAQRLGADLARRDRLGRGRRAGHRRLQRTARRGCSTSMTAGSSCSR